MDEMTRKPCGSTTCLCPKGGQESSDDLIYTQERGSAKRLTDLPVVTKRVGDASNPPTVALGNSYDFSCSCGNSLLEHRVRVVYGQYHPHRPTAERLAPGV